MKQQTMVAMIATNRRIEEAKPAKVVGLREQGEADLNPIKSSFLKPFHTGT